MCTFQQKARVRTDQYNQGSSHPMRCGFCVFAHRTAPLLGTLGLPRRCPGGTQQHPSQLEKVSSNAGSIRILFRGSLSLFRARDGVCLAHRLHRFL